MPLILLNKPFQVLSQFRDHDRRTTLAEFITTQSVYPAGRLDYDSEGLMLLTDDGRLQARISAPKYKIVKAYWAQVEGVVTEAALTSLTHGVQLKDGVAKALRAVTIDAPAQVWERNPPIRVRRQIPTAWIDVEIAEGRNRQVRRMTAAAGIPTLRLIRHRIGPWQLDALLPGESRDIANEDAWKQLLQHRDS
jgi:23S rRNA pseudouridine2457 synthase